MKIFLAIVIWAVISFLFAPKFVKISSGGKESNNVFLKWLVLFLLPIIIVTILSLAGVVVVGSISIIGLILILLPIILIATYFTVGISINNKKYKFFG